MRWKCTVGCFKIITVKPDSLKCSPFISMYYHCSLFCMLYLGFLIRISLQKSMNNKIARENTEEKILFSNSLSIRTHTVLNFMICISGRNNSYDFCSWDKGLIVIFISWAVLHGIQKKLQSMITLKKLLNERLSIS